MPATSAPEVETWNNVWMGLFRYCERAAVTIWERLSPPVAARVRSPINDDGTLQFKVATTWFLSDYLAGYRPLTCVDAPLHCVIDHRFAKLRFRRLFLSQLVVVYERLLRHIACQPFMIHC